MYLTGIPVRYPATSGVFRTINNSFRCYSAVRLQHSPVQQITRHQLPRPLKMSLLSRLPRDAARLVYTRNCPRYYSAIGAASRNERLARYVQVSDEVRGAIGRKEPVVALESAIITHGVLRELPIFIHFLLLVRGVNCSTTVV